MFFYARLYPPIDMHKLEASQCELFSLAAKKLAKLLWGNASVNDLPILYS